MKKVFCTLLYVFIALSVFSQSLPQTDDINLESKEDYHNADSSVLEDAGSLLSTPIDQHAADRLKAGQFLLKWMEGTPDHTFSLGQNILQYTEKDTELMVVYFAALTSFAIKNSGIKDDKTMQLNAMKLLIAYVDKTQNNIRLTRQLKKLSEADQKNELESFLKLN